MHKIETKPRPERKPCYTFIKNRDIDNKYDNTIIRIDVDAMDLTELLEAVDTFIKACGYSPKGALEYVVGDE
jgi:hypothetical protein